MYGVGGEVVKGNTSLDVGCAGEWLAFKFYFLVVSISCSLSAYIIPTVSTKFFWSFSFART